MARSLTGSQMTGTLHGKMALYISNKVEWEDEINPNNYNLKDIVVNNDGVFEVKKHPIDGNLYLKQKECLGLDEWSLGGGKSDFVINRGTYVVLEIGRRFTSGDIFIVPSGEGGSKWVNRYTGEILLEIENDDVACFLDYHQTDYSGEGGIGSWHDKGYY